MPTAAFADTTRAVTVLATEQDFGQMLALHSARFNTELSLADSNDLCCPDPDNCGTKFVPSEGGGREFGPEHDQAH